MKNHIKTEIIRVLKEIYDLSEPEEIVEIQKTSNKHVTSDYFSNIAMKLAKTLGENPLQIAEKIMSTINSEQNYQVWVAKPGYINFTLNQSQKNNIILEILDSENLLLEVKTENAKRIIVEFVSANPTGPLHVGHGRGAIYGNIISKYLEIQGHEVYKEYYVNDFGSQINKLVISVFSKIDKSVATENNDLYEGDYITDISKEVEEYMKNEEWNIGIKTILENNEHSKKLEACRKVIVNSILKSIKDSLNNLGIVFNNWFSESTLFEENIVDNTIAKLKKNGKTIKKEGALMFNDDDPRVLIK